MASKKTSYRYKGVDEIKQWIDLREEKKLFILENMDWNREMSMELVNLSREET